MLAFLLAAFARPIGRAIAAFVLPPASSRANYAKAARKFFGEAKGKAHDEGSGLLSYTPEQERDVSRLPVEAQHRTRLQGNDGLLTRSPDDLGILHPGRYYIDGWGRFIEISAGAGDGSRSATSGFIVVI